ncbi:thymidine phosphorylase [Singulisphaera acidiphila]|uniref:thymidine phosphorylase n=1 Tax=Singulisphaera acidiphila (strain ATCC BAA-1392 / DSM 18658 / VKM B-2454 / MOB10) TaxID=886293 RepID=L0D8T6_SINAD|nr:thymidine phosphorylase [Singulisphaera acidiphila]AGA25809.1 pyrimidine-nucleoside phosphorylase [Singulisphaera acidiphila DSM 18658]
MRAVDIIRKKRDGHALTVPEIGWMVAGLGNGEVADYQWSALLMAIVWRGMDAAETTALTDAMMRSGSVVDLSATPGLKVDKHSTGGVGDKTSLILAPIAAAAGVLVPMVSGRGLGHTGGTLDKLESIPGFNVHLDLQRYRQVLDECGLVLIGQTAEIAPADKHLYALRDATATVESIPLLASSIMSKKLAEGIDGLVLDVKTGNGAFLERLEDSRTLAETMCAIGRALGKRIRAVITRMDQPLGRAVGNALEVVESVACLRGEGPADVVELSVELAAEMVVLAEQAKTLDEARALCHRTIADGSALERFRKLVAVQGGDPRALDDPGRLPKARRLVEVQSASSGYVRRLAAWPIGQATMLLGAGRARVDSVVDPAVGLILDKKVGDPVEAGERLCTVHLNDESRLEQALTMIRDAFVIGDPLLERDALIVERF